MLQKDWKYQVAKLRDKYWINKVGTYGIASAQLYWGRLAALFLRILGHLFPAIDWQFVYVDDFAWLIRSSFHKPLTCAILVTLLALGCPLSWKKTICGSANIWLGFHMDLSTPALLMARSKHIIVIGSLRKLMAGEAFTCDEIASVLGRLQWATGCCPQTKAFLQPLWAWKSLVITSGRPSKLIRMIASLLVTLFTCKHVPPSPFAHQSPWHGASDGGARDQTGRKAVGG